MRIQIDNFGGIAPRFAPKMLKDKAATIAQNLELLSGKIIPLSGLELPVDNEGVYTVKGPIVNDEHDRYYSTDGEGPLMVTGGASPEAKIAKPVAPVGERVKSFNDIINENIRCFVRPSSNIEEEMELLEILPGNDENSRRVLFRYPGAVSDSSFVSVFIDSYYQIHLETLNYGEGEHLIKHLPDAFSKSPADGTNIELRNVKNKVIGRYFIESHNRYGTVIKENPGGAAHVLHGHDVEFIIRINYVDTIKDHYYLYRYVDDIGIEGPPSELSAMITRYPGETINLTNIPEAVANMSKVRIYRSAGVEQVAGFYFVSEVSLGTGTFSDDVVDADLTEKMPVYGNPPDGMDNLVLMSGGIVVANKGKDIYPSEPYLPHVFPSSYALNVDDNIVAMASRRNTLLVMTDLKLHMFSGNDPRSLMPVELAFNQACVSRQSVVKINGDVFYASPDGLVRVDSTGFGLLTTKSFRKQDWAALNPETWIAKEYNNKYMAKNEDGLSIIIDINEGIITTYTDGALAVWQSKVFVAAKIVSFNYIQLVAAGYPVTVDIMTAGSSVLELEIVNSSPRRLPVLRNETEWQFKITSMYQVDSLTLATSGEEL